MGLLSEKAQAIPPVFKDENPYFVKKTQPNGKLKYICISIDIWVALMQKQMQIFKNEVLRFPRLDTVLMIEKALMDAGGDYSVRALWKKLPKQVMWQTYMATLDYLEYSGKILIDNEKHPIWIWAPREIEKLEKRGLVVR